MAGRKREKGKNYGKLVWLVRTKSWAAGQRNVGRAVSVVGADKGMGGRTAKRGPRPGEKEEGRK